MQDQYDEMQAKRGGGSADLRLGHAQGTQKQRYTHAQGHDKQSRATQNRITGLANVKQRTSQWRRNTGADDQRRQCAHGENADPAPALQVAGFLGQLALQRGR